VRVQKERGTQLTTPPTPDDNLRWSKRLMARWGSRTVPIHGQDGRVWETTPSQALLIQFVRDFPGTYTQRELAARLGFSPGMIQRNIAAWSLRGVIHSAVMGSGIYRKTKLWIQARVSFRAFASTIVLRTVQFLQKSRRPMVRAERNLTEIWRITLNEAPLVGALL